VSTHVCQQPVERQWAGAPTAFRIWPAGAVVTDLGTFQFTSRSVELLLAEQAERGVKYPFDIDHLSLNPGAPSSSRGAVGWHALDVRDGELWAIDCQWSAEIRRGLEQKPPVWRYYSPVFIADDATREIKRYLGCALTNTPATHKPTDLMIAASRTVANDGGSVDAKRARELDDLDRVMRTGAYAIGVDTTTNVSFDSGILTLGGGWGSPPLRTAPPKRDRTARIAPDPIATGAQLPECARLVGNVLQLSPLGK
jgi:hypothetical protein